ncbi:hypothetical protein DPMN_011135 [Dreissena polymorpha]|uniref:Uncharacterized protein n=1 Tax=Dreissena polymorpha TaxID=45954 RepID=A0A9D4N4G2_DREPO|nr:hypothetical protein DPMN_011135 [Dreissena polymorpha]
MPGIQEDCPAFTPCKASITVNNAWNTRGLSSLHALQGKYHCKQCLEYKRIVQP